LASEEFEAAVQEVKGWDFWLSWC